MINKNYILQGFTWLLSGVWALAMPINPAEVEVSLNDQQPTTVGFVVHNSNTFYAAPGSIVSNTKVIILNNTTTQIVTDELPQTAPITRVVCVQNPLKQKKQTPKATAETTEVKKTIAQKTTIACPFGNYPSSSNSFFALHNGVATAPTVKTSPLTPLQTRGELTLCVEFYFLEIKKSICFYTNTQILQSKYIGQITTRPPPILMVNC